MDPRHAFKVAFLTRCIQNGHTTPAQIKQAAMEAHAKLAGDSGPSSLANLAADVTGKLYSGGKTLVTDVAMPLAALGVAAPIGAGYAVGRAAGSLVDGDDYDVEDAKADELANEYRTRAGGLRRLQQLRGVLSR